MGRVGVLMCRVGNNALSEVCFYYVLEIYIIAEWEDCIELVTMLARNRLTTGKWEMGNSCDFA